MSRSNICERAGRSGEFGFHQSKNASVDNRIQTAILASEISNLENLNGYFQTPGFTLRLRFPYLAAGQDCTAVYTRDGAGNGAAGNSPCAFPN